MIKHMIVWKLKDDAKDDIQYEIKHALEGLVGVIDGLISMKIHIFPLDGSTGDIAMESIFQSKEALDFYQKHELHQNIANTLVRPNVDIRLSFDFEL
jgi:hypothetical protein